MTLAQYVTLAPSIALLASLAIPLGVALTLRAFAAAESSPTYHAWNFTVVRAARARRQLDAQRRARRAALRASR